MAKSDFLELGVLNAALVDNVFPTITARYVALYSTDPTDANTGTELTGNGYARQVATFDAAAAGSTSNNNTLTFTASGGNWTTASHFGILDALTTGNLLYHAQLDAPRQANDGDSIVFDPGNIVATEA
jgi:hypothetical protein